MRGAPRATTRSSFSCLYTYVVDGCEPGRKTRTAKTARKNARAIDANYHRMFASGSRGKRQEQDES